MWWQQLQLGLKLGNTGDEEDGEDQCIAVCVVSTYKQRIISTYYYRGKVIHNGRTQDISSIRRISYRISALHWSSNNNPLRNIIKKESCHSLRLVWPSLHLKFFLVTLPQMSISIVSHILSLELVVFSVAEKTFVVLFFWCITCNNSQARWLPTLKWVAKWFSNNWHHTDQGWHNNTHRATLHMTCSILSWQNDESSMFILTRYRRRGRAILEISIISST